MKKEVKEKKGKIEKKETKKISKKEEGAKKETENKATYFGTIGMLFLALILYILNICLAGKTNQGFFAIICIFNGISFLYRGIKTKTKLNITTGIIWLIVTGLAMYSYIDYLIEISEVL